MKFIKKTIGAAMVLGTFATAVQAAEPMKLASLADVNGKVLVNKGKGYTSAKSGTMLESGDRVISLDGSKAAVVFPDGCVTELKENSLLTLDKDAGCGKKPVATGATEPLRYAQAIGSTMTDAGGGAAGGVGGNFVFRNAFLIGSGTVIALDAARHYRHRNDDTPISGQ